MTQQIQSARMKSARLKRLYEARQQVTELLYVKLHGDEFLTNPLKEALIRLDAKINRIEIEIKSVVSTIPGYNKSIHIELKYLSTPDLIAGRIDISIAGDGSSILDLLTGEISQRK